LEVQEYPLREFIIEVLSQDDLDGGFQGVRRLSKEL